MLILGLVCGLAIQFANIKKGDTVIDKGSGPLKDGLNTGH
jgi:hypothetical protein